MTRSVRLAPLLVGALVASLALGPAISPALAKPDTRRARVAAKPSRRPDPGALGRSPTRGAPLTLEDRLREELTTIWASRGLRRGVTAVYVVDAKSGAELYATHADDKLNPASNVKLISTAAVLDTLGPDWRYTTRLFGPAAGADGVARGSLYLRGSGDPMLAKAGLDDLARALAARGVRKVEGDVVLSDALMRDAVGHASVRVVIDGRGKPGAVAPSSSSPSTAFVEVVNRATITTRRRARLTAATRIVEDPATGPRLRVEIGGTIRQGQRRAVERPVERRSTFTAHLLRDALGAAGIEVTGRPRIAAFDAYVAEATAAGYLPVELANHRSAPMRDLLAQVNKRSINWLADRLIMTAGAELADAAPSMGVGLQAMNDWLARAGLDPKDLVVDTGSGLSYATKMSARQLVQILRVSTGLLASQFGELSRFDPSVFRSSLAIGGVDGTLRGRFGRLRGQVVGKTGTLTGCVALSGLVSGGASDDGLCFAIVTNGHRRRARNVVRREHEQMVLAMRRYLEARAVARAAGSAVEQVAGVGPAPVAVPARAPADLSKLIPADEGTNEAAVDTEKAAAAEEAAGATEGDDDEPAEGPADPADRSAPPIDEAH